jgi:UDP-2,3-diacylglucosamine hydrolase
MPDAATDNFNTGIISGSGALPFAVADSLLARGRTPVILGVRGFCDPEQITRYRHHWVALGQLGRLTRLLRAERCRDVMFIGGLVRPALSEIRLDFGTLRVTPRIIAAFRGGDNHLLTGIGRIVEMHGFRMVGVRDIAPDLLVPEGVLTRTEPDEGAKADIGIGLELLRALSPFDVGQAAIVIDGNVVAVEDIEGTDALLARAARLREAGRIRSKAGRGVLVKAPKTQQDLRFDLPTFGPRTIEGAVAAALGGIAIVAGRSLMAEPETVVAAADKARLFLVGLPA